uniref:Uncharacterized protein n=1 Tax=Oryza glumipatula TaxID=40148 RepID=A0A0E0BJG7_9ORYZ
MSCYYFGTVSSRLGMAATAGGGGEAWNESGGWGKASNRGVAEAREERWQIPSLLPLSPVSFAAATTASLFRAGCCHVGEKLCEGWLRFRCGGGELNGKLHNLSTAATTAPALSRRATRKAKR